ncbi:class I adenylate-forming enzyme family protein [Erythrobacter alti]|uniref:class I adenylate-forming enzyme family protein n=1 Tax=Erythrobacter alti TaxID=1896145 RepID=UPI0030F40B83
MSAADPIFEAVTATGSPFELTERRGMKCFANAPESLAQLIEGSRRFGQAECIVEGDRRLTFDDVFGLRDALAAMLQIDPGEHVAICMRNSANWLIAFLAVQHAGGVAVLINSRGAAGDLADAVHSTKAALVLADSKRAHLLRDGGYEGRLFEATDFPTDAKTFDTPPPASRDDPAVILFTSGTTGQIKGAVLTHENIITGVLSVQLAGTMVLFNTAAKLGMTPQELIKRLPQQANLLVYPLFHISGLGASFLSPFLAGSKIVILPRWDAHEAVKAIARERVTTFSGVPTMLWDILQCATVDHTELSSLTNVGTGGQSLPINLLDTMCETCPNAVMGTGYGLTETSGSVAMAMGEDFLRKRASCGRKLPLVDMRIQGPDGKDLPPGQAGEIVVRGAQVMQQYWDSPDETAAAVSADGWFCTGDIGILDEEGYLFIVDRKKDMVISGGENIYCAEVERVLTQMPQVTECATFGIPDDRMGEVLVAIVRADGLTEDEVREHVAGKLARYKAPVRVAFVDERLPRNQLDKVDKISLRAKWPEFLKEQN